MKNEQLLKIERLDQALQVWEEAMWICSVKQQAWRSKNKRETGIASDSPSWPPLEGPVLHYKEFRRHLLEMQSMDDFDRKRFQLEPKAGWLADLGNSVYFANQLAAWTHYSRRVYHVDRDLKAILGATSLEGLKMGDIHFPFKAFGVSLEEPIVGERGYLYDFILCAPIKTVVDGEERESRGLCAGLWKNALCAANG